MDKVSLTTEPRIPERDILRLCAGKRNLGILPSADGIVGDTNVGTVETEKPIAAKIVLRA